MIDSAISINNLTKNYKNINAIRNISFDISSGEAYGLIGPNGAGKTTIIMLLLGIIKPSSGKISILGVDPLTEYKKIGRKIGIVLDNHGLYENLSAFENMELFSRYLIESQEMANKNIEHLLKQLSLWERRNDKTGEFSKGMQQQRLAIGRALIHDPKLLIMDEPLSALDPESHKIIIQFIKELNQGQKTTVLITSHNLYDIENLCTHVAILNHGVLMAIDSIANLRSAKTPSILEIKFSHINQTEIEPILDKISGISDYTFLPNNIIHLRINEGIQTHNIINEITLHQIPVREVREIGNTLEDVYIEIIKREGISNAK